MRRIPGDVAQGDQFYAQVEADLADFVRAHRKNLEHSDRLTELDAMVEILAETEHDGECPRWTLAFLLAVAIDKLGRS